MALRNSNILAAFNELLGKAIKTQQGTPLDYGSEFRKLASIEELFINYEEKNRIVNII